MNNKISDIFKKADKVASSVRVLSAEYRFLQSLASKYKHFPHHEIIFKEIQCAIDELCSPSPANAGLFVEAVSNQANGSRRMIERLRAERLSEHKRLKRGLEPEAYREIFKDRPVRKINFRRIKEDVALLQRHKPETKLCEILTEIVTSNKVIDILSEKIVERDNQVKSYEKWVVTPEYALFITVYGRARNHQIKSQRKMRF